VGYRQVGQYLDGQLDYDAMCEQAIIATRQYAKRQLTWLRGEADLQRLASDVTDPLSPAFALIEQWLTK